MVLFRWEQVFVHFGEQAGVVRDSGFGFWCGSWEGGWEGGWARRRRSAGDLTDCEPDSRDHEDQRNGEGQNVQPV